MNSKEKKILYVLIISFFLPVLYLSCLWLNDYNFSIHKQIDSGVIAEFSTVINTIIAFFSLIISTIILFLAYKAYENFDVKKQYLNRQLETVTSLSEEITNTRIQVSFYTKVCELPNSPELRENYLISTSTRVFHFTFPDFTNIKPFKKEVDALFIEVGELGSIFPFIRYAYNPVLPKKIATALKDLTLDKRPKIERRTPFEDLPKDFALISPPGSEVSKLKYQLLIKYYTKEEIYNLGLLNNHVENIRKAIVEWLEGFGAKDINI